MTNYLDDILSGGGAASELATTGEPVSIGAAAPPSVGQVLRATSPTAAEWATPSGGPHAGSHANGGTDEINVAGLSGLLADAQNPLAHKASHQNGGADKINVAGLSGVLADPQIAGSLDTTGAAVNVGSAAPPTAGQVLTATTATAAVWQTPSGGGGGSGDPFVKGRVYLGTALGTASAAWMKLAVDTVDYDTASIWSAANKNFRPTVAGYYLVTVRARVPTYMVIVAGIGKNSTQIKGVGNEAASGASSGGTALIQVNGTTDTIDARVYTGTSGQNFTTGTFDTYLEILGPFNNVGTSTPAAEPPTSFSFASNAVTLDVTLARNWTAANTLTGNSTITLTGGLDGANGTIQVKQDATGNRTLAFVVAGRTALRDLNVGDTNPLGTVNSVTEYHYYYCTIGGTAYIRIYKVYLTV